ncbi:MAG: sulfatase-like hydrolase/transferase [Chitinophagaceae bacterium]|nr:sulfatase-like hydrolase/transferase [Chitinophagaceae bacterium]
MKFLLPVFFFFYTFQSLATCTLPAPKGFKSNEIASCQFTVKWKQVTGASAYHLQYKAVSSSNWIALNSIGNVTAYTISGLAANTSYNVKVAAVCASNEEGTFSSTITVATTTCSIPNDLAVSGILPTSATVTWNALCGATNFSLRYRKTGTSGWTTISNISSPSYQLSGLTPATAYQVRVRAKCGPNPSDYSTIVNFSTPAATPPSRKNVLLVIIDDARFDSYQATGGPVWFHDTAMSRVANEGANFELSFPAQSQCAPSRASITSGLYPHLHGVTDNPTQVNADTITQITLPQILHDNGYYTGLIGKYHISKHPQPGYDFWMEMHGNDYTDAQYNLNGIPTVIPGHATDVVSDSAIGFLKKVPPNQPFYLWLAYMAPHTPLTPRPEDNGMFDDEIMPSPLSPDKYTQNYPGFIYNCHAAPNLAGLEDFYRSYFELLNGVDVTLGGVFNELKTLGLMDSTLIIFMSDNGYMIGEHKLSEKQMSYEESIKIPIFMRYPGLIPAGTKVSNNMAMNIDIAPTILDFAGIEDTFGMQGVSLLKMMNHTVERKEMLYEFFNKDCLPDIRSVRSLDYKYVKYNCSQVTEELFDLHIDPLETINHVNDPGYATILQQYRDKLTYWRNYYLDFTWDSLYSCSLTNPQRLSHEPGSPLTLLTVFPNPSTTDITIHFISSEKAPVTLRIMNTAGVVIYEKVYNDASSEFTETLDVKTLPAGNYFTIVQQDKQAYQQTFTVQ